MKLHIFEFEDQPWFPAFLRNYQTDFLAFIAEKTQLYLPAEIELFRQQNRDFKTVVDLASGAGYPAIYATSRLRENGWNLLLSDLFPSENGMALASEIPKVKYLDKGVDALHHRLPEGSIYTMFNAFHHFSREEQLRIANVVVNHKGTLLVFEPLQPTILVFLKVFLATSLGVLISAPFIKPFSMVRLVLTYIIPLGLLATFWDGLVSVLKSSSRRDLKKIAASAKREGLSVSYSFLPSRFAKLTFIKIE